MSATEPIDTHYFSLTHVPVEDWQRVEEMATTTGFAALGTIGGVDYGLWEMSAGVMRDVEGDAVFLVVSGRGRVEFDEPARSAVELHPGSLVRLGDGMKTRWYIDQGPLRKLFIAEHEQ